MAKKPNLATTTFAEAQALVVVLSASGRDNTDVLIHLLYAAAVMIADSDTRENRDGLLAILPEIMSELTAKADLGRAKR